MHKGAVRTTKAARLPKGGRKPINESYLLELEEWATKRKFFIRQECAVKRNFGIEANACKIHAALDKANASLVKLFSMIPSFRTYLQEKVGDRFLQRYLIPLGENPKIAISRRGDVVFTLRYFGFANIIGTVCLGIRTNGTEFAFVLTQAQYSRDLDLSYHRIITRESFGYVDQESLFLELDSISNPEKLLEYLVKSFAVAMANLEVSLQR